MTSSPTPLQPGRTSSTLPSSGPVTGTRRRVKRAASSRSLLSRTLAIGAVAAVSLGLAGVVAPAQAGTADVPYGCEVRVHGASEDASIGPMSWPIRVTAQLPATIAVGHPVTDARVSATVTMPAEVTAMLYRIGQRFVDGRAMAQAHVGSSHELTVPMSVPQTPVPASGAATFTASGVAEAFTAAEPGSADVIAGGFSAALRSSATADMAQSYKVTLACTPSSAVSLGSMTAVAGPAPSPPNPNVTPAPPAPNATTTAPPAPPVPPNQPAAGDPGLKNVTVDWADSYSSKLVIRADARTAGTVQIGTYSADRTMLSDTTWTITAAGSQSFTLDVPDKTTHVSLSWGQNGASNWQLGDSTSAPTSSPTPSASPTTTTANGKIVPIAGAASSPVVPARVQTG